MTATERPQCPVKAWCALDPGHEDPACSAIQKVHAAALQVTIDEAIADISSAWHDFLVGMRVRPAAMKSAPTTPECVKCDDSGWQDCSADPHCGDASHGGYCNCLHGQHRQQEDQL